MSEFDGSWEHQNNPACNKSVKVLIKLKLDTIQKKKNDWDGKRTNNHPNIQINCRHLRVSIVCCAGDGADRAGVWCVWTDRGDLQH